MAKNIVIGSNVKFKVEGSGLPAEVKFNTLKGTMAVTLYVYGKYSEKNQKFSAEDEWRTITDDDNAMYFSLDTTGWPAGNLYAEVEMPYTDPVLADDVKSITIVDTGVRLVNA